MKALRKTLKLLRPYRWHLFGNAMFNLLSIVGSFFSMVMVIPFLDVLFQETTEIVPPPGGLTSIDDVMQGFNHWLSTVLVEHGKDAGLLLICSVIVVSAVIKNVFRYLAVYVLAPARNGVVRRLRESIYTKMLSLPVGYFTRKRRGDFMARASGDILEVETSIMGMVEVFVKEPFTVLFFLGGMLFISPTLTALVLVMLPITALLIGRIARQLKTASRSGQDYLGRIMDLIDETLEGLRVIKAFNAEKSRREAFSKRNQQHYRINNFMLRRKQLSSPLTEIMSTLVVVALIYFGSMLVFRGEGNLAGNSFMGFLLFFAQLVNPAKMFSTAWYNITKGAAALERIEQVLAEPDPLPDAPNAKPLTEFRSSIKLESVHFSYPDAPEIPVLRGLSLEVQKGQMVALVGPSGAGKSTLAELLLRFHDVTGGRILVDGTDIRELRSDDLRRKCGLVTQQSILFNDSVRANITLGNDDASEDEIVACAKAANAHEFIMNLEDGYATSLGDRGNRLSGGQRQRITIARALLKNPDILLLDEATSALDSESEALVQEALSRLMQNRTSIVIAHRLSTVQHADVIVVMREGEIVEVGKHHELMAQKGSYHRLVEMQAL